MVSLWGSLSGHNIEEEERAIEHRYCEHRKETLGSERYKRVEDGTVEAGKSIKKKQIIFENTIIKPTALHANLKN